VEVAKTKGKCRAKSRWTREKHQTRSATRKAASPENIGASKDVAAPDVVNSVRVADSKNFREAMKSPLKDEWTMAMVEELKALKENGGWTVELPPVGSHVLHTKWVFKTKTDADGAIERFKARLVACGNEQLYGIDYNLTFAAVMELSTVKVILVFARRWRMPARHGDISNAYVKAEKEQQLEIYLSIPKGMIVPKEVLRACGVSSYKKLALRLKKSLYGLKQAGRLWSQLLHAKLVELGFTRCITDMCLYYKRDGNDMTVVGAYVDDLMVTASKPDLVEDFFVVMKILSIKDLGKVSKFLGMRVHLDEADGYSLDQQAAIEVLLEQFGLVDANGVKTPIGEEDNDAEPQELQLLPSTGANGEPTIRNFQSLVGSLLWIVRCTRPDISFAVHRATRHTHQPRTTDWKLAKRSRGT